MKEQKPIYKLLAMLLCLAMVIGMFPAIDLIPAAQAADQTGTCGGSHDHTMGWLSLNEAYANASVSEETGDKFGFVNISGNFYLTEELELDKGAIRFNGATQLDLNGYTIKAKAGVTYQNKTLLHVSATFTLCDSSKDQTGTITGLYDGSNTSSAANIDMLIYCYYADVTMYGGTLGWGKFAYDEGFIYYGEMGYIYRLHVNTGAVDHIPLENAQDFPVYLFTTPEHIGYVDGWNRLLLMTKDGAQTQVVREGNCSKLYIDGTMLYTNDSSSLDRTDLTTGQTVTLAENTHGYFVDETYIYALTRDIDAYGDMENGFLRSPKETVAFEPIPLSFYPSMIFADGEDLYFARGYKKGQWQVIQYRDGKETPLPVFCKEYQVVDGCVIYLDEETVKSYDLTTGEHAVLQENVFSFSVLEGRYICFILYNDIKNIILDRQTGTYMELYLT